jgi:hypothetical protein
MSWTKRQLVPPLPSEAQPIVDALNTVSGAVVPILNAASTLLNAASIFFQSADLYKALMTALVTQTEDLVNDLFGSGAFELVVNPFTSFRRRQKVDKNGIPLLTPEEAINLAIRSLDDQGDLDRPQFSDAANISAFGILVTAPDISVFLAILEALLSLWNIDDIQFIIREINRRRGILVQSRPPDWDSLRFNQIKALGDVQKELLRVLAIAKGYLAVPDDAILDLIAQLQRKVNILTLSIAAFQAVIDALTNTPALSGVYMLDVPLGVGGNNRLKAELRDPQFAQLGLNKYTFMALYVGGGPSAAGVDSIRQLLA